ncbi:maleylpyruvate isomerase family mycothiol-dependent enzyme [Frigoribacterium sp. 2-23]|uniref:maleylpyruvate isomerase family mycothiol-dependent enzyme n=1 Tax=Frigoribacterium sp. 2-23 TaxID=3415006 RepID=UPI003C7046F7
MSSAALFSQSADSFADLVSRIRPDQWEQPGLGVWTVRSLVGHTARAILTVENYLAHDEPGDITIPSAVHYYTAIAETLGSDDQVAARGVEAGVWLGDEAVPRIRAALAHARELLAAQPRNRVVSIGGMGIALDEYLRTRVFELVVHTIDLSRATGLPHTLPSAALAEAVTLAACTAAGRGHGEEVLLALTGRAALPEGFSVV